MSRRLDPSHLPSIAYFLWIAIEDARVLRGKLPPTVMLIVRRWITMRGNVVVPAEAGTDP